jgi:Domain of unknown function (DUF4149)
MWLHRLIVALWAGLLVTVGLVVAPGLFRLLDDRELAGRLAGGFFWLATVASFPLGLGYMVLARRAGRPVALALWAMALLGVSEWAVRPQLTAARLTAGSQSTTFALWHGLSTLLYLSALVAVMVLLVRDLKSSVRQDDAR